MAKQSTEAAGYNEVDEGYFEKRKLKRTAGVASLWALGVGAVISGDFFGWNFGLAAGGFGGYLGAIFGTGDAFAPLWWLAAYAVFVGLNVAGAEISFRFTMVITIMALGVLSVFYLGAIPRFDFSLYALNIEAGGGGSRWLPQGYGGIIAALPFAIWFYLAIEELPLAAEEAHNPQRDMPKGILYGLATLTACAFLTLILNTGIAPGASALASSDEPLFEGFKTIFGDGIGTRLLALVAVAGLVASFHTIIYAYGRQIFSLSRAGYFPRALSVTNRRGTPHVALLAGGVLGYAVAFAIHRLGPEHPVGAVLLNMAVFGAVISYCLQMVSFILLRIRMPHIERPYRSPFGIFGAAVALGISAVTLIALFVSDPIYQKVVIGAAVWYGLGLLYFALHGRKQLVVSPEERFALENTEKGRRRS